MRLIKQSIERKDGSGSATLLPEEPEDMVGHTANHYQYEERILMCESSGMLTT